MIAALLYKEYREHRSIWLALAVIGVGGLVGVPMVLDPAEFHREPVQQTLAAMAAIIAWTYGMVCGAMLLAGEREAGTQTFLDSLPTTRLPLWIGKCVVGLLFLVLQLALLGSLAGFQGFYPEKHPIAAAIVLVSAGLAGFGWGMLFSALTSTVLNAIGLALLVQFMLFPFVLIVGSEVQLLLAAPTALVAILVWLLVPLPLSALLYSHSDRKRQAVPLLPARPKPDHIRWQPLWWLAWQQTRGLLVGLVLFSLVAAMPVIGAGLLLWPIIGLALGAFCGVTVFLDEQSGPYRFLGEQRFPLGRFWLVKVGLRAAVLLVALLVVLIPATVVRLISSDHYPNPHHPFRFFAKVFGSELLGRTIPVGLFLFFWPLQGFAVGHLCGVLFRKPLVALVVSFGLAALLAGVWVPSLVTGDLQAWQVVGGPLVLLVCARLLMRVWASDRLLSWTTARRVALASILVVGLIFLGLWVRVAEIPDGSEPDGFAAFVAGLPTPEENQAGSLIGGACSRVDDMGEDWRRGLPAKPLLPGEPPAASGQFFEQAHEVIERGWPDGKPELAAFLDRAFSDGWWKQLAEAAHKPIGIVEDPRTLGLSTRKLILGPAHRAGLLLAARGLQMQKMKGDPAIFLDHLTSALALVRNLLNHARPPSVQTGLTIETEQMQALTWWLGNLGNRPELLARAAEILRRHRETLPPATIPEQVMAQYLIARNSMDQTQRWLLQYFPFGGEGMRMYEPALVETALRVPWEKMRQERLLRARFFHPWFQPGAFPGSTLLLPGPFAHPTLNPRATVWRGAAELMVALRRYQADKGQLPATLAKLVPAYLDAIPLDPFDAREFRYRLSAGEEIFWPDDRQDRFAGPPGGGAPGRPPGIEGGPAGIPAPPPEPMRKVPAGQGILWSIGEDRRDDGGRRQGLLLGNEAPTRPGEDLIFLVPPLAKRR